MNKKKIGFIVNPIAGMGGRVGLKGTDGEEILKKAISLGATPVSPKIAESLFKRIDRVTLEQIEVYVGAGLMGEYEAKEASLNYIAIGERKEKTSRDDTLKVACEMLSRGVELIVFFGGDGTAKDILEAVNGKIPVLGVPSGVKMFSAVFSLNVEAALIIIKEFAKGEVELHEREVLDINEESYREDKLEITLKGYLLVPETQRRLQSSKSIYVNDQENKVSIAKWIIENMDEDELYILGPGTTVAAVSKLLNQPKTLLGVDIMYKGKIIKRDANEEDILRFLDHVEKAKVIISPIGKQGFILGRGNQQISSEVIRRIGMKNLIIVSTKRKIYETPVLHVETGDEQLNREIKGYKRVVVDYNEEYVKKIV